MKKNIHGVTECLNIPRNPDTARVYRLLPTDPDDAYYRERTDRNIGWITPEEQELLKHSVIGIAGCGGMGGMLAERFLRLGIGEIRIADNEVFDVSNINRQFAASRASVGKSKAFETARMLRRVTDDSTIVVYPQGICEDTVDSFVSGCDVICDEIEFWAIGARILLHAQARAKGVSVFNCNTIGVGTRLFFFTPTSATMEECLDFTYPAAMQFEQKFRSKTATADEIMCVLNHVWRGLLPAFPEYCAESQEFNNFKFCRERLFKEGKAAIIASNPPLATGFLCDHTLFYLLRHSAITRNIIRPPAMPGYLYFDAALKSADDAAQTVKVVTKKWW